jgi:hypothetical protein
MTDDFPPIHFGAKPLEAYDQRFSFSTEPLRSQSLCIILSDERMGLSLMNRLLFAFVKCTYRIYSMLLKTLPCALYTRRSPMSVQVLQSRPCLAYLF